MRFVQWLAFCGLTAALPLGAGCRDTDAAGVVADSKPTEESAESDSGPNPLENLETREFPLLVWSAYTVDQEYFDRERFDAQALLLSALTELGLHTPEFFAELSDDKMSVHVRVRKSSADFGLDGLDGVGAAADRLEEILSFAQSVLDLEAEPLHELEYAAINGLFAPLDPHTILLTPEEHADLGVRTKGEFGGIGAQIRPEGRRIVIVRVLPGMPAEAAGLAAGDIVLKIGEQATVNMTASEAQNLLRGPLGTKVAVKVRRNKASLSFEVERQTIRIESVESHRLPGDVAYLRISNFQENTAAQVRAALEPSAELPPAKAVVFDLRGNAGGLLLQATEIVDMFVARGELVIVRSAFGREVDQAHETTVVPAATPVVLLVDEEAASAAEIVSGGLKALGRGVIVGRQTFGKGTVQVVRPANPYGRELALKLTIAEYLVAGDRRIQATGVVPDLQLQPVALTSIAGVARYFDEERFERARERSRMANHPSSRHELERPGNEVPVSQLRYLDAGIPTGDEQDEVPLPMLDPEVRIAQEVAVGLGVAPDREARAQALRSVADRLRGEEDDRIVAALGHGGVDWSVSPGTASQGRVSVKAEIVSTLPIKAGEPFVLRVSVTNEGTETLERVHAITDCVHDELDGIELMIGKLAPEQSAVRDVSLHVMPWHSDFADQIAVAVHIGEPDPEPDGVAKALIDVVGAPAPALSYDFWIVDDPALAAFAPPRPRSDGPSDGPAFAVAGNGDGMLQAGERVLLVFEAQNTGAGTGPDVRAMLRNLSGSQGLIEEGLVPLGALAPSATALGSFGISVSEAADPAVPFELHLVVGDATLRTSAEDKLRFAVLPKTETIVAGRSGFRVNGEPIRLYGGAHPSSRVVATAPDGTALLSVGTLGNWKVVSGPRKDRRYFLPGDLESLSPDAAVRNTDFAALDRRILVSPPSISVGDYPQRTSAATVLLSGVASDDDRVRDIVVMVRPPGPSQFDRKVYYVAADVDAKELRFEAEVPLELGGNRIIVYARDGAKVQRREDVWVFRDPQP